MAEKRLSDLIWKPVKNYEGLYEVSNYGNVKSLDKTIINHYNINTNDLTGKRFVQGKLLKPHISSVGYYQITLSKSGSKPKQVYIHKLVAEAFIDKNSFKCLDSENKNDINIDALFINHKDENKLNNCVDNLEWCTHKYNMEYSNKLHPGRISKNQTNNLKLSKPVICIETGIIYPSAAEASRQTGLSQGNISNVCRKQKIKDRNGKSYTVCSTGGYHWEYIEKGV